MGGRKDEMEEETSGEIRWTEKNKAQGGRHKMIK